MVGRPGLARARPWALGSPQPGNARQPGDVGRLVAATIRGARRSRDAWPQRDQSMVGVIVAAALSLANLSPLRVKDLNRVKGPYATNLG